MNIQGLSGKDLQVRTFLPGTSLDKAKAACQENDLVEIILKNESGLQVAYASEMGMQASYLDTDKVIQVGKGAAPQTHIPYVGDKVSFGDLKGEVMYIDREGTSLNAGYAVGGFLGLFGGAGAGIALATAGATDKLSEVVGIFWGGMPGALIGMGVGAAAGVGLAQWLSPPQPDDSALKAISH